MDGGRTISYDLCHSLRQAMAPGQNSIVQNSDVLDGESNQDGDVESWRYSTYGQKAHVRLRRIT